MFWTESMFEIVGYGGLGRYHVIDRQTGRAVTFLATRADAETWIKDRVREYNGPLIDASFEALRLGLVFAIGWWNGYAERSGSCPTIDLTDVRDY